MDSLANSTKEKKFMSILLGLSQITEEEGKLLNAFYNASIASIPQLDKNIANISDKLTFENP